MEHERQCRAQIKPHFFTGKECDFKYVLMRKDVGRQVGRMHRLRRLRQSCGTWKADCYTAHLRNGQNVGSRLACRGTGAVQERNEH